MVGNSSHSFPDSLFILSTSIIKDTLLENCTSNGWMQSWGAVKNDKLVVQYNSIVHLPFCISMQCIPAFCFFHTHSQAPWMT